MEHGERLQRRAGMRLTLICFPFAAQRHLAAYILRDFSWLRLFRLPATIIGGLVQGAVKSSLLPLLLYRQMHEHQQQYDAKLLEWLCGRASTAAVGLFSTSTRTFLPLRCYVV